MFQPELEVPERHITLRPGYKIKLGRFEDESWIVGFGWYSFGGNRQQCGWYLTSCNTNNRVKPLQRPDLDDIYIIEY